MSYDGMHSDYEKHNEAVRHGWIILYFMSKDLDSRSIGVTIRYILSILKERTIIPPSPTTTSHPSSYLDRLLRPF
jgi:hypothetical protein